MSQAHQAETDLGMLAMLALEKVRLRPQERPLRHMDTLMPLVEEKNRLPAKCLGTSPATRVLAHLRSRAMDMGMRRPSTTAARQLSL